MSFVLAGRRGAVDLATPRLHALVVAVGDYPYLCGPTANPAALGFGLKPLTTTVHTGRRIAEWLVGGMPGFVVRG